MADKMTPEIAEAYRNTLLARREELQKIVEGMRTQDGGFDPTEVRDGVNLQTTEEALAKAEQDLKELDELLAANTRGAM